MLNANDGYDEWRLDWYNDAHGGMTQGCHNHWCRRSHHSICHLMTSSKEPVSPAITEEAKVLLKNQEGKCVVEDSDNIPRNNSDGPYIVGDSLSIIYKPQQPAIERHELSQSAG